MQFEKQLSEWSAIYKRLKAAQERLRAAMEAGVGPHIEECRREVADLQAQSDAHIQAMQTSRERR